MPRPTRTIGDAGGADLLELPVPTRPTTSMPMPNSTAGPLIPENIMEFMNALPVTGEVVEWILAFREALRKLLGDVDRVAVRVDTYCDLINASPRSGAIEIIQIASPTKKASETVVTTELRNDLPPSAKFRAEVLASGPEGVAYHVPDCYDYYYRGTAYLGSILLLRERSRTPISERTRAAMKGLEPFIIFAFSDVVTRHHYMQPIDRVFNSILTEVSRESNLSVQDLRILSLMLMGLSYKQVADRMELSIDTIRKHTKRIYRKTRTGSLPELFAKYFSPRMGIEGLGEENSL